MRKLPSRRTPLTLVLSLSASLLLFGGFGCTTSGPRKPPKPSKVRSGPVNEIHLFGYPVAVNTDHIAGPDTLGIHVFVSSRNAPRGLPIKNGHIEVLMFDTAATRVPGATNVAPLRTWRFSANDLRPNEGRTAIGIGYRLALPLGDAIPKSSGATLVARYIHPNGAAVESSPSTISLLAK